MPYSSIEKAKEASFPTKAEGIDLTIAQINKLASIYDAIKAEGNVDNAMAVAWTTWKKVYKKEGDSWIKREKGNIAIINASFGGAVRRTVWQGKEYLIAPVIALVEGVHEGSAGAIYYSKDEIAKFIEAWNGVPLPVMHPQDNEGYYISCNSPEIIEKQSIGHFFNAQYQAGKLKGELWIEIEKANQISKEIIERLENGQPIEVSTGLWSDDEIIAGEWNGKKYAVIARNIRPDHIALLPNAIGACSWQDGCGAPRINSKGGDNKVKDKGKIKQALSSIAELLGFKVQETSHEDIRSKLQQILNKDDRLESQIIHYIKNVYDDHFIYEQSTADGVKLFKQKFKFDGDEIQMNGEPKEVKEDVRYLDISHQNIGGEKNMDKIKEIVNTLIANEKTSFNEDNREWLMTLDECKLKALEPKVQEIKHPEDKEIDVFIAKESSPFSDKDKDFLKSLNECQFKALLEKYPEKKKEELKGNEKPPTVDEYIGEAPDGIREFLTSGVKLLQEQKDSIIKGLIANKRNKFTENQLKEKHIDELKALAELAQVEVDYSGQGGTAKVNSLDDIKALQMPTMNFKEDKK